MGSMYRTLRTAAVVIAGRVEGVTRGLDGGPIWRARRWSGQRGAEIHDRVFAGEPQPGP